MNFVRANCKDIQSILDAANKKGIFIKEVSKGWSESSLSFDMSKPLDNELRDYFLKKYPALKYVEYEGSLHDKPYRGFKCMKCTETVIFPEQK